MEVAEKTLGSWTRSKNDVTACAFDAGKSDEVFKFVTYSPSYLQMGSCVAGNTQNCSVFQAPDLSKEGRLGQLTNLNVIQRSTTNDVSMGLRTSPDFQTGPLVDPRLIQDMSVLESRFEQHSRVDVPSSSVMNEAFMDDANRRGVYPVPPARAQDLVSTRVSRRNAYASQSCVSES